jgi:hypothetical protein
MIEAVSSSFKNIWLYLPKINFCLTLSRGALYKLT